MQFETLKRRQDFLRVRNGARASKPAFLVEGKRRRNATADTLGDASSATPRIGFTITKKIGNAVVRNRIRRRLKGALQELADGCAHEDTDYVVVARKPAADQPFAQLRADLEDALAAASHKLADPSAPGRRRSGRAD
ncbi:MAG: ribonuclease P protein component [Pseudomonadota bacterium]